MYFIYTSIYRVYTYIRCFYCYYYYCCYPLWVSRHLTRSVSPKTELTKFPWQNQTSVASKKYLCCSPTPTTPISEYKYQAHKHIIPTWRHSKFKRRRIALNNNGSIGGDEDEKMLCSFPRKLNKICDGWLNLYIYWACREIASIIWWLGHFYLN